MSTRNFTQLAQGTFLSNTSGRDPIYDYAWNYIGDHWLWGTGVVNDRVWINNAVMMETSAIGAYPHNIFIEWMMQFGLVAGVCICILFLLQAGKYAFGQYDKKFKTIFLIILATGCFPLFFSGSYISYPLFYAALGICRGYKRHRTKEEAAQ